VTSVRQKLVADLFVNFSNRLNKEFDVAKGNNRRGNREKRKPKAVKTKPTAAASPFAAAPGMSKGNAGKKAR
jgi:hypothetical protein